MRSPHRSKALFFRIKKSIIRFQSYEDMMAGDEGQLVHPGPETWNPIIES
jgi:hypothetical protein